MLGFATVTWAPLVPFAKARAGLDEGALGLLLFCVGGGAILAMPPAGALAARFGCRRVLIASAALVCATLPVLATASSVPLLAAALVAFGAGAGGFDCVVNVQAIIVERASGRALMSGFHGLYSFGGMVGAAAVSALLGAGSLPLGATLSMDAGIRSRAGCGGPELPSLRQPGARPGVCRAAGRRAAHRHSLPHPLSHRRRRSGLERRFPDCSARREPVPRRP
ncbi:MAG: MFS transporter, partial [Methylobacteriaceae bacterium]|nr:MFS transporter [Methylobacteriaceae bacterium]